MNQPLHSSSSHAPPSASCHDILQHNKRSFNPRPVHITMRNEPHRMQRRILRPYAVRMKRIAQLRAGFPGFEQSKITMFDRTFFGSDRQPRDGRDAFRQPLGIFLIDVSRAGDFPARSIPRSDHARLTHASPEHFP